LDRESEQNDQHTFNAHDTVTIPRAFSCEHAGEQDDGDKKHHLFGAAGNHRKCFGPGVRALREAVAPRRRKAKYRLASKMAAAELSTK